MVNLYLKVAATCGTFTDVIMSVLRVNFFLY